VEVNESLMRRTGWALLIALLLLSVHPAHAQEGAVDDAQPSTQAGLIIVSGDAAPVSYCVAIAPDEEITGNELLQRAGVQVLADQNAMGATICSLNGTGCAYPAESCFCQCEGTPCTYWSYWRQDEAGAWQYAIAGAANTRIRAGTVEGWVWGEGTTSSAITPPVVSLADICAAPEGAAADAPEGEAQPILQEEVTVAPSAAATMAEPAEPVAPTEATGATAQPATDNNSWALAGLAALVIIPVAALLLLRRRKDNA
jgi:hypothetical protein